MILNEIMFIISFVADAVWQVWPAFLISITLGFLVRALKLDGVIRGALTARIGLAIVLATAVGAFSPFCSCSVVPIVTALLISGVPLAPVMAFWIASPTMDPEIFALSVATLGWPLAVARLGATLALSLGGGYLTLALMRSGLLGTSILSERHEAARQVEKVAVPQVELIQPALIPVMAFASSPELALVGGGAGGANVGCSTCSPRPAPVAAVHNSWDVMTARFRDLNWREVGPDLLKQTWELGRWLLLAFVLEALIIRYVPQVAIASLLGGKSPFAVPLAALIGIPLYLNNISALPIVSGLLAQGMQPGAAIAFLIAGPITTVPAMTAVWGVVRRRVFALYVGIGLIGSMVLGMVVNVILR